MKVGYARVSTVEQDAGFEAQIRDLEAAGCTKIFSEKISGTTKDRPELLAALNYMRAGDEFVCTKLDRLARDLEHLLEIASTIERLECNLIIIGMGIDTNTPVGRLMLMILGAIAEFEVSSMKMRQQEGILRAKADGKYTGSRGRSRKGPRGPLSKTAAQIMTEVLRLDDLKYTNGTKRFTRDEIANMAGCGRRTVYRILSNAGRTEDRLKKVQNGGQ